LLVADPDTPPPPLRAYATTCGTPTPTLGACLLDVLEAHERLVDLNQGLPAQLQRILDVLGLEQQLSGLARAAEGLDRLLDGEELGGWDGRVENEIGDSETALDDVEDAGCGGDGALLDDSQGAGGDGGGIDGAEAVGDEVVTGGFLAGLEDIGGDAIDGAEEKGEGAEGLGSVDGLADEGNVGAGGDRAALGGKDRGGQEGEGGDELGLHVGGGLSGAEELVLRLVI